jgi:hypothetical protein
MPPRVGRRRRGRDQRRPRPHGRWGRPSRGSRAKAAIIERGDVAVTGRAGRRSPSSGGAARGSACRCGSWSRRPSWAGTATPCGSGCRAWGSSTSGCADATRRRTRPSRTRCSTRWRRRASRACPRKPAGAATRRRAGRGGSSWSRPARGRAGARCCSTGPGVDGAAALAQALRGPRPVPPRRRAARRAADARLGVDGDRTWRRSSGPAWPSDRPGDRRGAAVDLPRDAPADLATAWQAHRAAGS